MRLILKVLKVISVTKVLKVKNKNIIINNLSALQVLTTLDT